MTAPDHMPSTFKIPLHQRGNPHMTLGTGAEWRARPQAVRHSQCKSTRCAQRVRKCNLTPQIVAHLDVVRRRLGRQSRLHRAGGLPTDLDQHLAGRVRHPAQLSRACRRGDLRLVRLRPDHRHSGSAAANLHGPSCRAGCACRTSFSGSSGTRARPPCSSRTTSMKQSSSEIGSSSCIPILGGSPRFCP